MPLGFGKYDSSVSDTATATIRNPERAFLTASDFESCDDISIQCSWVELTLGISAKGINERGRPLGDLSPKTGHTNLTAAASFFVFCCLAVAALAFVGFRGRLFRGLLRRLQIRQRRNFSKGGFGRSATA